MIELRYARAQTIAEAVSILQSGSAKPLAGGTDLLIALRNGAIRPRTVVEVSRIPELRELAAHDGALHIGAAVTFRELAASPLRFGPLRALAQAAASVGSPQIRAAGTVGGNIATGSPAADLVVPLVALGARVEVACPRGMRDEAVESILGAEAGVVNLAGDELIVQVIVPLPRDGARSAFCKLGRRRALSIARLSCAVVARLGADRALRDVRVAVGAASPHPERAPDVEAALEGASLDSLLTGVTLDGALLAASAHVERALGPRASMPYKREAIKGVIWQAVAQWLAPD